MEANFYTLDLVVGFSLPAFIHFRSRSQPDGAAIVRLFWLGVAIGLGLMGLIALAPLPPAVPTPQPSISVLVTTFCVLVATGLGAGIAPARIASRVDPAAALRVT